MKRVIPIGATSSGLTETPITGTPISTPLQADLNSFVKTRLKETHSSRIKRICDHWKILLVVLIPVVGLNVLGGVQLYSKLYSRELTEDTIKQINHHALIDNVIQCFQKERGTSALFLASKGANIDVLENLRKIKRECSKALNKIDISNTILPLNGSDPIRGTNAIFEKINEVRISVENTSADFINNLVFYTNFIKKIMETKKSGLTRFGSNNLFDKITAIELMIRWTDILGIARALGSSFLTLCEIPPSNLDYFTILGGESLNFRELVIFYETSIHDYFNEIDVPITYIDKTLQKSKSRFETNNFTIVCKSKPEAERFEESIQWFSNMTLYIDHVFHARFRVSSEIGRMLEIEIESDSTSVFVFMITQATITVFSFILSVRYLYCIDTITLRLSKNAEKIKQKTYELKKEKEKTERLLYQMLPPDVARQLQEKGRVSAKHFPMVSVYFSDIVEFTVIGSQSTPMQIVELLNNVYSIFDECLDKYDVYKVETIGDAYMVASGVPKPNEGRHASNIANMALDIRRSMARQEVSYLPGFPILIRIGIHSGPCVAGVVGTKMPRYCLFGDTVNTASRMESTGIGGKIHISDQTATILRTSTEFTIIPRGSTKVKGKGTMETYWLEEANTCNGEMSKAE